MAPRTPLNAYLILLLGLNLVPNTAVAGGLIGDLLRGIESPLKAAGKSLDEAHKKVKEAIPNYGSKEAQADIAAAQVALVQAESRQREVEAKVEELGKVSAQIELEKDELLKNKRDLEARPGRSYSPWVSMLLSRLRFWQSLVW